ncbi:Phenylacetaldoxime dehydratase [Fusarium agapanthi]|uniref:Phenylacetaldoxime dehydratase n=1 Tax=Fusarium agapanthi TaxID=1803897 RepID=A0A9P5BDZ0_9HYPO|nr:Phenylacetaldoxime dehydratase [Fusarium agapanthi]
MTAAIPNQRRQYWCLKSVVTAGMEKGMVSVRACHAFAGEKSLGATNGTTNGTNGTTNGTPNGGIFPGLDYIRQAQILYWTDLSKMEHMGRWDKGHVKLRHNFMSAYGPGGVMQDGDILLWVDLGIIKGDEIDAEYVGCYEVTGFLAFDKSAMFASTSVAAAELPPIFDKPIACQPIEW